MNFGINLHTLINFQHDFGPLRMLEDTTNKVEVARHLRLLYFMEQHFSTLFTSTIFHFNSRMKMHPQHSRSSINSKWFVLWANCGRKPDKRVIYCFQVTRRILWNRHCMPLLASSFITLTELSTSRAEVGSIHFRSCGSSSHQNTKVNHFPRVGNNWGRVMTVIVAAKWWNCLSCFVICDWYGVRLNHTQLM